MDARSSSTSMLFHAALILFCSALIFAPSFCYADFGGSLESIKFTLTRVILPTLSVIGLALAAISFFTGNPQAKQHIIYAILGCVFGFGAQGIVDMIRDTVNR